MVISVILFQSTPPARGATQGVGLFEERQAISIHAPREGSDFGARCLHQHSSEFQSTPPARGATLRF